MPLRSELICPAPLARTGRVAVLDIGSNSIRCVVYDELSRVPTAIFNEKILCGLGRTVQQTGALDPAGRELALANLRRFARLVRAMRVDRLDVLATAAVRDASDGQEFVDAIHRDVGIDVTVVSGEEEARLSALGVLSGTPGADGLMGDLGGGSLEVVDLDHGKIGPQATAPLGPLRLADIGGGREALTQFVDRHLAGIGWLERMAGRPFYPVGGNWRAMARLHMEESRYPLHVIHHYEVEADEARTFAAAVSKRSKTALEKDPAVSRRRGETLPLAALVFERLIAIARPSNVVFSAYGLREGHLFDLLPADMRRADPLLSTCYDIADRLGRFGEWELLAAWTAPLFPGEDETMARLRLAACLLSDLGWVEHPDYRAEHGFLRVLRMPFAGVYHRERAFLALVIHTRYGGPADAKYLAGARKLLKDAGPLVARARLLGLTLRLGHTLTGGVPALLTQTQLVLHDDTLELHLPVDVQVLNGDVVRRRLDAVAAELGRTGVVREG